MLRDPNGSAGATPCLHLVFAAGAQVEEVFVTDNACGDWNVGPCLGRYRVAMKIVSRFDESSNPSSPHQLRVGSTIHLADAPAPSTGGGRADLRRMGQAWAANLLAERWHRFEPYAHRWRYSLTDSRGSEQLAPVEGAHYFPMPPGGGGGCADVGAQVNSVINQAFGGYATLLEGLNIGAGAFAGGALGGLGGPSGMVSGARDAAAPPRGAGPRRPGDVAFQPVLECYTWTATVELGWGTEVSVQDESGNVIGTTYENGTSSACADASRVNGSDADGDGWCDGPGR